MYKICIELQKYNIIQLNYKKKIVKNFTISHTHSSFMVYRDTKIDIKISCGKISNRNSFGLRH